MWVRLIVILVALSAVAAIVDVPAVRWGAGAAALVAVTLSVVFRHKNGAGPGEVLSMGLQSQRGVAVARPAKDPGSATAESGDEKRTDRPADNPDLEARDRSERAETLELEAAAALVRRDEAAAIEKLEQALAEDPSRVSASRRLVDLYSAREAWEPLLEALNKVGEHSKDPVEMTRAFIMKGDILYVRLGLQDRETLDKAVAHYGRSVRLDSKATYPMLRLAEIALHGGAWNRASSWLGRVERLKPEGLIQSAAMFLHGVLYAEERGDTRAAMVRFRAAAGSSPEIGDQLDTLAVALEAESGRFEALMAAYRFAYGSRLLDEVWRDSSEAV